MKDLKIILITFLTLSAMLYCSFAFIQNVANPTNWTFEFRNMFVGSLWAALLLSVPIAKLIKD